MCPYTHGHTHTHTHKCVLCSKSLYLGVEEHIRDILNCHRVAKDCFIEVVYQWLSHEDGTVWSCEVNEMFMSLSLLTTGNSLHLHRLELIKVCIYVHTLSCVLSIKVEISCPPYLCGSIVTPSHVVLNGEVPLYKTSYPSLKVSFMYRFCHMHTQSSTHSSTILYIITISILFSACFPVDM